MQTIDPRIYLRKVKHFGTIRYFPECDQALSLCLLAETKTLSLNQQLLIKRLGFEIVIEE